MTVRDDARQAVKEFACWSPVPRQEPWLSRTLSTTPPRTVALSPKGFPVQFGPDAGTGAEGHVRVLDRTSEDRKTGQLPRQYERRIRIASNSRATCNGSPRRMLNIPHDSKYEKPAPPLGPVSSHSIQSL